MNNTPRKPTRKPGADRDATAARPRKHDPNFRQSRDLREDRGERQIKLGSPKNSRLKK